MTKLNHSATLSIGGKVNSSWASTVSSIRGGADSIKRELSGLKGEQRSVTQALRQTEAAAARMGVAGSAGVAHLRAAHESLKGQQIAVEAELKKARREAERLGKNGSEAVRRLETRLTQLKAEEIANARMLDELTRSAERFGVEGSAEVAKLRAEHARLGGELDRQARRLRRVQEWNDLDVGGRTMGALRRVGSGLATVGRYALFAGTAFTATAAAGVGWFTKSSIDAAAAMETLETALVTTEGSSAKAAESMQWIAKFAATTPYELGEVGEAFARLRARGIDPTDGTLRTLGDTAASMGKPVMAAVEAMADAVTGENERLKEFGIRASKAGGQITYFYKNAAGEDVKKRVRANSQEAIRATLAAIWNEKYAGSMERQSRTWRGLMSNLSDQWTQFQVRVMRGGVFDLIKGKAESLLETVNKWAEDGTLERWAGQIGEAYRWAFDRLQEGFEWTRAHWPEITSAFREGYEAAKNVASWVYKIGKAASDAVGGPENLAKGLLVLGAAKTLAPLFSLAKVGWDIVAWLSRASGLTGAVAKGLSSVGGSMAGAAGSAPGKLASAGNAARGALNAPFGGVGLGASVAGASTGAIAGTVAAGGLLGAGIGMAIDAGVEAATGKALSTRAGEWLSSDVDAMRNAALTRTAKTRTNTGELTAQQPTPAAPMSQPDTMQSLPPRAEPATAATPQSISPAEVGAMQSLPPTQSSTTNDNRSFSISVNVDAKGADAEEVAELAAKKVSRAIREEGLSSYG